MHYDPRREPHGLPHDPFTALVVPRPIGWISTLDAGGGLNLAPYSFFNALSGKPPFVMFASNNRKHSQANAEEGGEFTVSIATYAMREPMNASSAPVPAGVDEAALLGVEMAPSRFVRPPRVAAAPAALECVRTDSIALKGIDGRRYPTTLVVGEVVGIYIDDAVIVDGKVDFLRMAPLSRLGYRDYGMLTEVFEMPRPSAEDVMSPRQA
jgi:flavin reductase (DIM6/NTAB) family NADH-FMN oxidoreductase RutF